MCFISLSPTAFTTGTLTALPNCLYLCVSDCPSVHPSGNPCSRSHSVGVNRLIDELLTTLNPFLGADLLQCCVIVPQVPSSLILLL